MKLSRKIIIALTVLMVLVAAATARSALIRDIPSKIVQEPDTRLHTRSEEVTVFDEETAKIADELRAVIKKVDSPLKVFGLGMAAPQIGYNKRIIALKNSYDDYLIMVNPESIEEKWQLPSPSTCFSLKGMHFLQRPFWMKMKYQDLDGNPQEMTLIGLKAATMKQEIDHLNGILLTDY